MIPKKIHYCWFGRNKKNKLAIKCINSWKKHCPDFEILEWNEDNYNVNVTDYTKEAYEAKKYAFVSDYARFDIINREGGIYLDVDVEIIKDITPLLNHKAYMGFEEVIYVNPGLGFGSVANNNLLEYILSKYNIRKFINDDGSYDYTTVVVFVTNILQEKGLILNNEFQVVDDCTIYPKDYFQPIDLIKQIKTVTDNTFSIHHYAASWYSPQRKVLKTISKLLGTRINRFVRNFIKG